MAYKIKRKKEPSMRFSEETEYYLYDGKNNTYDNHLIKGWKKAVHLNLAYQLGSGNEYVVPMEKKWILKHKIKNENFLK